MSIELTAEQGQALQSGQGNPIDAVDPITRQHYVILGRDQFERVRPLLAADEPEKKQISSAIPFGIVRSQHAFWRDLPELLKNKSNHGKWVCYHGDTRIGISFDSNDLIRECIKLGLTDDEFDLDIIEPRRLPPWDSEEIAVGGNEVEDYDASDQAGALL